LPASRTLKRLHAIRSAEEQQCRTTLDAAVSDLRSLERMLARVKQRRGCARSLIAASIRSGVAEDRMAALEEASLFDRLARALAGKIAAAEQRLSQARNQFMAKRVERRQVETLLEAARVQAGIEASRKNQSALDEWFRSSAKHRRPDRPQDPPGLESGEPDLKHRLEI